MSWKAGIAKDIMTPQSPVWLAGYGCKREAKTTIHELWLKAIALEDSDGNRAFMLCSDHQGFPKSSYEKICSRLKKELDLNRDQIFLGFSHNHCGPRFGEDLHDYYPVDAKQEELVESYTLWIEDKIVALAKESFVRMREVDLSRGNGNCSFAVNRRDNKEHKVEQMLNENQSLKGPVDHQVPVLSIRDHHTKELLGLVFSYSCHPTTLNFEHWCGDYPGFAQVALESNHPGVVAMFIQACGADQNPLPRRELHLCQKYGLMLAGAVEEALLQPMTPVSAKLRTSFEYCKLGYQELVTKDQLNEVMKGNSDDKIGLQIKQRWAKRFLEREESSFSTHFEYPVQVWSFGESFLFISMGGEAVVDYSLNLKKKYGDQTWVCGYANTLVAYIPSKRVYDEGGYEGGAHIYEYGYHPAERWDDKVEENILESIVHLKASLS